MSIERDVTRIIKEQLDVDEKDITLDARFIDDLRADSLALLELTSALKEYFVVDIPDEDIEELRTVEDVIAYITARK